MCSDEERRARFEAAWRRGRALRDPRHLRRPGGQPARPTRSSPSSSARRSASIVDDPETAEALCPKDHSFGTKRPCLDTGYYETFNLPHVRLVDLRKHPITTITETGIDTRRRVVRVRRDRLRHRLRRDDRAPSSSVDITGRDGVTLEGEVGRRPDDLPRPDDGRVPEPVHDHRPGQPVGAVEHDRCRSSSTSTGSPTASSDLRTRGLRHDRAHADGRGRLGAARQRLRRHHAVSRRRTPGTWAPTCPASRGCSCPTSAASTPTARSCDEVVDRGYLGFELRGPGRCAVQRRRRSAGCSPTSRWCSSMMAGARTCRRSSRCRRRRPRLHGRRRPPMRPPGPEVGEIVDGILPGAGGDLRYRLYRPADDRARTRSSSTSTAAAGCSAATTPTIRSAATCACGPDAVIVSVDYRHAPEARFPAAADDAFAAVQWVADHAIELGGIPGQLAVAGWSAGGNLAAVVGQLRPRRRRSRARRAAAASPRSPTAT